jgi:hypothetical protein
LDVLDHRKPPPTTAAVRNLKRLIWGCFCYGFFLRRPKFRPIVLLKPLLLMILPTRTINLGVIEHVENSSGPSIRVPVAQIPHIDILRRMSKSNTVSVAIK